MHVLVPLNVASLVWFYASKDKKKGQVVEGATSKQGMGKDQAMDRKPRQRIPHIASPSSYTASYRTGLICTELG